MTLPGCQCKPGYIRETDHPWSKCVPESECIRPTPDCAAMGMIDFLINFGDNLWNFVTFIISGIENSYWDWEAPICFPNCYRPQGYDADDKCQSQTKGMCVCNEGFVKEKPHKKANCVTVATCWASKCNKRTEQFTECVPKCFDDCRSTWYPGICFIRQKTRKTWN